ncbi:MAG: hypothetical protein CMF31_04000 [Kordiimonas sp.]|nr:hypothetical protein [Kordiimonas sp.]
MADDIAQQHESFRRFFWIATIFTVPAIVVMCALGTWQIQRLAWKEDVIARMDARLDATPVALPVAIDDLADWEYRKVVLAGRFDHSRELHLFGIQPGTGKAGYFIFAPLMRGDGPAVLVNRGWVDRRQRHITSRAEQLTTETVSFEGIVRLSQQKIPMGAENSPSTNDWYYPDLQGMAMAAGLDPVSPAFVYATTPAGGGDAQPVPARIEVVNNHLAYVFTWFSMATVLAIIYGIFLRRQYRQSKSED